MRESVVRDKSFAFALRVVKASRYLQEQKREYVMSKQFLRSGTAIGALVREAEQAESKRDFVHKMAIALKEASESEYWIELLNGSGYIDDENSTSLLADLVEILKLLTSIIKASKAHG